MTTHRLDHPFGVLVMIVCKAKAKTTMNVKQMQQAHATATAAHNWTISLTPKQPGQLRLEFWEPTANREAAVREGAQVNYSTKLGSWYRQTVAPITGYFLYSNDFHFVTRDNRVFFCSFAAATSRPTHTRPPRGTGCNRGATWT